MIGSLPLSAPELESRIIPALQSIEDRLMEVVNSADETINPPTSHLAEAGGKRLRPVLYRQYQDLFQQLLSFSLQL